MCVSTLRFECGVSDGGMGVCVERQMCVWVCVWRDWALYLHLWRDWDVCGGVCVERLGCVGRVKCVSVCGGRDMVVWGVCVQMGSLCV